MNVLFNMSVGEFLRSPYYTLVIVLSCIITLLVWFAGVYLFCLLVKSLRKYLAERKDYKNNKSRSSFDDK